MRKQSAKIIVLTNQKGGCGKTTVTIHLASGLAKLQQQVLVIDADQQHSTRNWAGDKEELFGFQTTILPANQRVDQLVQQEATHYDFIIIDCPPAVDSVVTYSSLLVADLAVIPLLCSANDLWALTRIIATIQEAKLTNQFLQERLLINQYKPREKLTAGILEAVQTFAVPILQTKLGTRTAFRESAAYGLTVYHLKDHKAIREVASLAKEIKELIKSEQV